VSRHFSEFPTFSISAETLVNTAERKEKIVRLLWAGSLPKCEIMYKARMNYDSAVIGIVVGMLYLDLLYLTLRRM